MSHRVARCSDSFCVDRYLLCYLRRSLSSYVIDSKCSEINAGETRRSRHGRRRVRRDARGGRAPRPGGRGRRHVPARRRPSPRLSRPQLRRRGVPARADAHAGLASVRRRVVPRHPPSGHRRLSRPGIRRGWRGSPGSSCSKPRASGPASSSAARRTSAGRTSQASAPGWARRCRRSNASC